jgi:hypothetical protein
VYPLRRNLLLYIHGNSPKWSRQTPDLTLTEVVNGEEHWFLAEAGSDRGREVLAELDHRAATEEECLSAAADVENAGRQQTRHMDTTGIRDLLYRNFDPSALGPGRGTLPGLYQLHHGVSYLLLHHRRRRERLDRRPLRALEAMGLVLHDGFLVHTRRELADLD